MSIADEEGISAHAGVVSGPVIATNAHDDALEHEDRDFVDEIAGRVAAVLSGR